MFSRILSAFLLAPPLVYLILKGTLALFFLLELLVATLMINEWQRMHADYSIRRSIPHLLGAVLLLVSGYPGLDVSPQPVLALLLMAFFIQGLIRWQPGMNLIQEIGFHFVGMLYCVLPLGLLLKIRLLEQGGALVCLLLFTLWATDIGGYFAGRALGKRKLAPKLSPGKTWAGFWGGTLLAVVTGVAGNRLLGLPFGPLEILLVSLLISFSGQTGDLAESMLKRETGVKDSGSLIPGHGGLLDRLDSLLFAIPVFYLFLHLRDAGNGWMG